MWICSSFLPQTRRHRDIVVLRRRHLIRISEQRGRGEGWGRKGGGGCQSQFTFVEQIFIGTNYEQVALSRQRKQTWISQGFLLKEVQSLVSGERAKLCCVRSEVRCPLPGSCRNAVKNCVFLACLPVPDSVSETQPRLWGMEEGVGGRRRLGTKAKKVVWTRVQGTSKQLRTMKRRTRETRTADVAGSWLQPGENNFQVEVSKSGRWGKWGTKTSARKPDGKHFGAHLPGDAKDSRAAPRKTPSLAYRHLIGIVCGRPCLCLPEILGSRRARLSWDKWERTKK